MIPRYRRRSGLPPTRRPRRAVAGFIVAILVAALVIGEVTADVLDSGKPAALIQERSYVAAVVPVIDESTALVPWLHDIRYHAASLGRQGLLAALARLVSGSAAAEQQVASIAIPAPTTRLGDNLVGVFAKRTEAARTLAGAVTAAMSPGGRGRALAGLERAAADIHASDAAYLAFRQQVPAAARRHSVPLPTSSWASSGRWTTPALQRYLTALTTNPQLVLHQDLTILAVTLQPPALRITPTTTTTTTTSTTSTTTTTSTTAPGASSTSTTRPPSSSTTTSTSTSTTTTTLQLPGPRTTSWLAPTRSVAAIVVVANGGNVAEPGVVVRGTLSPIALPRRSGKKAKTTTTTAPPPLSPETVQRRIGTFAAGSSLDFSLPSFTVRPGTLYRLTVTISTDGPSAGRGLFDSQSLRLEVAAG